MWVAGIQVFEPRHLLPPSVCISRKLELGPEPRHTQDGIWGLCTEPSDHAVPLLSTRLQGEASKAWPGAQSVQCQHR